MCASRAIRVFIADDHPLMRLGLRLSLQQIDGIEVIGEASDGFSTVEKIQASPPDVSLIDVDMPGLSGIGAIRILRRTHREMTILVLSTYNDETYIRKAMDAGADGYVLKAVGSEELAQIIRSFGEGRPKMSPYLVSLALGSREDQTTVEQRSGSSLTHREDEVLRCIVEGRSSKEIAESLNVSPQTVKTHLHSIYEKLGVKNRVEAAMAATREKRSQ
ncbi:MAG: response regulator transcription factor [Deltaproteobacteria bacterium]|nr:response regulator transcription factor [Deltaproteobacteria bacterium]